MEPQNKTKVKRSAKRAVYDQKRIYDILDNAFICHIAFVYNGYPVNIPTIYGRKNNTMFIHGAGASRMLKELEKGVDCSICVTIVDGLVLARSAFHHSANYRSVVAFGKTEKVIPEAEKREALKIISDQIIKLRWEEVREPNEGELLGTTVLKFELHEVSAKVREGGPVDEKEDYNLNIWAGVVPMQNNYSKPVADENLKGDIEIPESVQALFHEKGCLDT